MGNISTEARLSVLSLLLSFGLSGVEARAANGQDENAVANLRKSALSGDDRAAYELADWHVRAGDGAGYLFYLRLAAEQGNCDAVDEYRRRHNSDLLVVPDSINRFIEENHRACQRARWPVNHPRDPG
jgi:hypothetical protein